MMALNKVILVGICLYFGWMDTFFCLYRLVIWCTYLYLVGLWKENDRKRIWVEGK